MEIRAGGGVFGLGDPGGRGGLVVPEIRVEGGGQKNHAIRRGGVDFFWNNPLSFDMIFCAAVFGNFSCDIAVFAK